MRSPTTADPYESLIPALSAITSSYEKNIGTSNQENTTLVLVANLMEKLSQLAFQTANLSVQEKRASLTKEELLEQLKSKEAQLSNQK
ncbi:hypothetical protein MDAP_001328 [Mitosporidium daphniae]